MPTLRGGILIPITLTLVDDKGQHLIHQTILLSRATITHSMMNTSCQFSYPHHLPNGVRNLGTEVRTIVRELRHRATPFRDIVAHENLGRSKGGEFINGYRIHRLAPTEPIRNK